MKIVGGMLAHNEDWVIGLTARASRLWCDELIVIDHCSTDNTRRAVEAANAEMGCITILSEQDAVFHPLQMYKRIISEAKARGASHVAILDADELLSGNLLEDVRHKIAAISERGVGEVPWIPVRNGLHNRDATGPRAEWKTGFVFQGTDGTYPDIDAHAYDIHYSRLPLNIGQFTSITSRAEQGGLLHLQYVDERRLRAKQVRWKMMEMLRWRGRRSVQWINEYYDSSVYELGTVVEVPKEWWKPYQAWEQYVSLGVESVVEREVKQLLAEDASRFAGLDLFGL